jgi:hypothetical protein
VCVGVCGRRRGAAADASGGGGVGGVGVCEWVVGGAPLRRSLNARARAGGGRYGRACASGRPGRARGACEWAGASVWPVERAHPPPPTYVFLLSLSLSLSLSLRACPRGLGGRARRRRGVCVFVGGVAEWGGERGARARGFVLRAAGLPAAAGLLSAGRGRRWAEREEGERERQWPRRPPLQRLPAQAPTLGARPQRHAPGPKGTRGASRQSSSGPRRTSLFAPPQLPLPAAAERARRLPLNPP